MTNKKYFLLLMVFSIIIAAGIILWIGYGKSYSSDYSQIGRDELIDLYMKSLKACDSTTILQIVDNNLYGRQEDGASEWMWLDEAEKAGMLKPDSSRKTTDGLKKILEYQASYIVTRFGDDAFENYSYDLIQMPPEAADSTEYYYLEATGEKISFEDYNAINAEFWENIAKENEITTDDIFNRKMANTENRSKGLAVFKENYKKEPAKRGLENTFEIYQVKLSFYGKDTADNGDNEFRFYITNKSGAWTVKEGLEWNMYYPEAGPDI